MTGHTAKLSLTTGFGTNPKRRAPPGTSDNLGEADLIEGVLLTAVIGRGGPWHGEPGFHNRGADEVPQR